MKLKIKFDLTVGFSAIFLAVTHPFDGFSQLSSSVDISKGDDDDDYCLLLT